MAGVSVTFISREPLEQAQHDIQQQRKAIEDLTTANENLRRHVRALGGQIDELKKALVVIVNEVDFHEHELSDISDVETATLLPRVEQAAERLDELDFRCDESNRRVSELERQVHELVAQLTTAEPPDDGAPEPPWPPPVVDRGG
jgi:chromosome segregation ATPase